MTNLNVIVKPILYTENRDLWIFIGEINQMPFSMIEDGMESCRKVMAGEYPEMSWGFEVFELIIHEKTSILEYNGDFITEIPTIEIYNMLIKYRDKLRDYQAESQS
jgi:hypothetical protein